MTAILITFAALVVVRLIFNRKQPDGHPRDLGAAVRAELGAWFVTAAVLIGILALLTAFAFFVGPIPEIHEW